MGLPTEKYTTDEYLKNNPTWDIEDSPWKADNVIQMLSAIDKTPESICEIGCGAGGVLVALKRYFKQVDLFGFDIARDVSRFWESHKSAGIDFKLGDFFQLNKRRYDVLLLLDVIEHLQNPFDFIYRLQGFADYFIFHIPLDLSAISVLREAPLLYVRNKVGHIHYFTKTLALSLLEECNYEIIKWQYTGASINAPNRSIKTKIASIPRHLASLINKDWGVRLFGGETLMILAKAGDQK